MPGLRRELDEDPMQDTSGGFDHFSIVVVAAVQTDRYWKISGPAMDLERDANVRFGRKAEIKGLRPTTRGPHLRHGSRSLPSLASHLA